MNKYAKIILSSLLSIYFLIYISSSEKFSHFIDLFNLIIHEAGHMIFFMFGSLIQAAGGSITQIALPVIFAVYFCVRDQKWSASVILFWIGSNFIGVGLYMKDAIAMNIPLLGGDAVIHDWNFIFTELNILKYSIIIGQTFYVIGVVTIISAICLSVLFSFSKEK